MAEEEQEHTRGAHVAGLQGRAVGPQQFASAVKHEGVDGRPEMHGCHSQILNACIHFSDMHDGSLHLA